MEWFEIEGDSDALDGLRAGLRTLTMPSTVRLRGLDGGRLRVEFDDVPPVDQDAPAAAHFQRQYTLDQRAAKVRELLRAAIDGTDIPLDAFEIRGPFK